MRVEKFDNAWKSTRQLDDICLLLIIISTVHVAFAINVDSKPPETRYLPELNANNLVGNHMCSDKHFHFLLIQSNMLSSSVFVFIPYWLKTI